MGRSILEIIVQSFKRGNAVEDSQKSLEKLGSGIQGINRVLGTFGLALGAKEAVDFANASREAARATTDSLNALRTAASGIADYREALRLAREATKGMATEQQLSSSMATLFGAGLATNAQEAANLAQAGTVLSNVFASAGASQDLFVRLLSSGSVELFNNFGLTRQMVQAKQQEIEATTQLQGEEARLQAIKAVLIDQSQKYQSALSEQSVTAAQAVTALSNLQVAVGNLLNAMDQSSGATSTLTGWINTLTDALTVSNEEGLKAALLSGRISQAQYDQAVSTQNSAEAVNTWVSSARAMDIAATSAAASVRDLTTAQSAQQSAGMTNREADAYRQMAEARGQSVEIQTQFEKQQAQEAEAEKRNQIKETEKTFQRQAQTIAKAFDEVGSQISGAVGGAINDLAEVWNPGGETDAANGAAQWARRMAAIAAGGLQDEWANPERWANFGGDKSVLQPLFNAISSGDDTQVKAQAQALLANKTADLFDANMIAAQVEQKLRAQQIQQTLNDKVNALLGERGLQAVTNVTQQIAGVATDTQNATTAVGESVAGLGTSAEESGAKIGQSFTAAIAPIDTLNSRLKLMAGLIERVNTLAGQAAGNISAMNPPAAPASDAANKMGGNAPL